MFFTTDKEEWSSLYKLLEAKGRKGMVVGSIIRLLNCNKKDRKIIIHKLKVVTRNSKFVF
jgi:hypothetical protein